MQKSWILMQKFTYISQKWYAACPWKISKLVHQRNQKKCGNLLVPCSPQIWKHIVWYQKSRPTDSFLRAAFFWWKNHGLGCKNLHTYLKKWYAARPWKISKVAHQRNFKKCGNLLVLCSPQIWKHIVWYQKLRPTDSFLRAAFCWCKNHGFWCKNLHTYLKKWYAARPWKISKVAHQRNF